VYRDGAAAASGPVTVPAGGGAVDLTVPSFSPTTAHRAYVTIGGWPVPATWDFSPWSCVVVNAQNNPVAGRTCTVTEISAQIGEQEGLTGWWPDEFVNFTIKTSHQGESSHFVRVVADLSVASGLPAGWFDDATDPATSRSTSIFNPSNIIADSDMRCDELPWYRGRSRVAGTTSTFIQQVRNDRDGLAWTLSPTTVTCR